MSISLSQLQLLDHVQLGMCVIDSAYKIIFINRCLEDWLRCRRETLYGTTLQESFPETSLRKFTVRIDDVLAGGPPTVFSPQLHGSFLNLVTLKGDRRTQRTTISPIQFAVTHQRGALIAIEDVTSLAQQVEEIKAAHNAARADRVRAEDARRSKAQFLATMSHEIRTPMSGVLGMAEVLLEHDLNHAAREIAQVIKSSGESMLQILNDILDFSKLEAKKFSLVLQPFDIAKLLNEIQALVKHIAQQKQVSLIFEVDTKLPRLVNGDSLRLRQIFTNLLSNAIKFTESGGAVLFHAELESIHGKTHTIAFRVLDSGIGIEGEAQKRLFQRFSQVGPEIAHQYGGSGLGLAIASELVSLMGGTLKVSSRPGLGTVFSFVIALEEAAPDSATIEVSSEITAQQQAALLKHRSVLVAEDNLISQRILRNLLERDCGSLKFVTSGTRVLDAITEGEKFDLILMDVEMPEMNGHDATRAVRTLLQQRGEQLPIIGLTAHVLPEEVQQCFDSGMDEVLTKPIQRKELFATVAKVLRDNPGKVS